jgi:hypothetical protein
MDLLKQVVTVLCSYVQACLAKPDLLLTDDGERDFLSQVSALAAAANDRLSGLPPGPPTPVPPLPRRDSAILPELPVILKDFEDRQWTLLYRGSRDGFGVADFHRQCDGHAHTLTIIRTVGESDLLPSCVFGAYTACTWDSVSGYKRDTDRRESFLFNTRAVCSGEPRRYAHTGVDYAIYCNGTYGPTFGNGHDLHVCDGCDRANGSWTKLGTAYSAGAGDEENRYLALVAKFRVQEIEIFEISPKVE